MLRLIALIVALSSTPALAKFLPDNDLHLYTLEALGDVTKEDFDRINEYAIRIYAKDAERLGKRLVLNPQWDNDTVNASASQRGNTWYVNMYGGLARRPEVTKDGYALVLCHEIGHHFGGFPFYQGRWAASEGQSDYFATHVCARRLWGHLDNSEYDVDDIPKAKCDAKYRTVKDRQLCYRVAMGGKSLARLLGALRGRVPEWETPDASKVSRTNPRHPAAQCRLDTYLAGALCDAKYRHDRIPGKDNPNGQDSTFAEHDFRAVSCATQPRCWFAPRF